MATRAPDGANNHFVSCYKAGDDIVWPRLVATITKKASSLASLLSGQHCIGWHWHTYAPAKRSHGQNLFLLGSIVIVKTPNPKNNHEHRDKVQCLGWILLPWGKALFPPTALLQKVFGQFFWMIHARSCQTSPSWIETGRQRQKLVLQQDPDRHRNFI